MLLLYSLSRSRYIKGEEGENKGYMNFFSDFAVCYFLDHGYQIRGVSATPQNNDDTFLPPTGYWATTVVPSAPRLVHSFVDRNIYSGFIIIEIPTIPPPRFWGESLPGVGVDSYFGYFR